MKKSHSSKYSNCFSLFFTDHFTKCQEKKNKLRKSASGSKTIHQLFSEIQKSHHVQQPSREQEDISVPKVDCTDQSIEEDLTNINDTYV